jgi:hypothetical protein
MKMPHKLLVVLKRVQEHGPVRPENGEWRGHCPAHDDRNPSFYACHDGDRVLLSCKAGCANGDIIETLDLVAADLEVHDGDPWLEVDANLEVVGEGVSPPAVEAVVAPPAAADADLRDRVYKALLGGLPLSEQHRENLKKRGLDDGQIALRGYRSVDRFALHQTIGRLRPEHADEELLKVPGIVRRNDRLELAAAEGLLIAVRNADGQIVALKLRHDRGENGKYSFVSSAACGGPSPGAPVHLPLGTPAEFPEMRVTEGELKADVASALSSVPTISVPGVSSWATALPLLERLKARRVRVAFDADGNPATRRATLSLIDALREAGMTPLLERWDPEGGKLKGIDDLMAAGKAPEVLSGDAMLEALAQLPPTPDVIVGAGEAGEVAEGPAAPRQPGADDSAKAIPAGAALAPFPNHVFPAALRAFCEQVASATSTPPDYAGVGMLAVAGAAIGNARRLCLKAGSWYEPPLLFAAAVGDPSSGKTPALDLVVKPFEEMQHELLQRHEKEVSDRRAAERLREQAEQENKALAKGEKKPLPELPPEPAPPARLVTSEATSEALHLLLKQNPRGLLMNVDELVGWTRGLGQYKGGRGNDRQLWLSVWSAKALTVDRRANGGSVISVPRPHLSVLGGLTPEMIGELEDRRRRNDGFLARILFTMPSPVPDVKWTDETLSEEARRDWRQTLAALRALEIPPEEGAEQGAISLSAGAKAAWVEWFNALKAEQRSPDLPPCLIGPWGKLISYCGRCALILFLLRVALGEAEESTGVDEPSLRHAIDLTGYFKSHARAVYSRLELSPEDGLAMRAVEWLRRHGSRCTPRELQRAGVPGIRKASVAQEVLKNLADWGYGHLEGSTGGKAGSAFTFVFAPR